MRSQELKRLAQELLGHGQGISNAAADLRTVAAELTGEASPDSPLANRLSAHAATLSAHGNQVIDVAAAISLLAGDDAEVFTAR